MTQAAQHTPERTCLACRKKRPQRELVRITLTSEGWRVKDGKRSGRGAYVCANSPTCWVEKRLRRLGHDASVVSAQLNARAGEPPHEPGMKPNS